MALLSVGRLLREITTFHDLNSLIVSENAAREISVMSKSVIAAVAIGILLRFEKYLITKIK